MSTGHWWNDTDTEYPKYSEIKTCQVPLCALQNPYVLVWYGTRPSAMTGRRLTGSSHLSDARSSSKPARHRTKFRQMSGPH